MALWNFIQTQLFGMRWLASLVEALLALCGVDVASRIGGTVHFFIYDTIKIIILLTVLIFVISYVQSFFPPERTKKILSKFSGLSANILAALLGTVTPFCSCSSIPLFMGFTGAGIPLGVTFSFLISSPLVDLASLILLASIFGFRIAGAYVLVGLVLAVVGGSIISLLHMEDYVEDFILSAQNVDTDSETMNTIARFHFAWNQAQTILGRVFWYIIIGVGIGATIHNWIPKHFIEALLGSQNPFSVLLAVGVGVPMYADIFGTLPIAEALASKGVGIGTILSFMMAVTALSLPSIILLKKALKPKLLVLFVSIVIIGIIIVGYFFNAMHLLVI